MIMVQATAAKWSGSNEEMFEFARGSSAEAPEGSSVHAVVPMAHLEKWLNLPRYTPSDRNIFAMCFFLMHDYQAQLEQMRLIGPLIQASPWNYQGDPGWAYERARTMAQQAVGLLRGSRAYRAP